MKLSWKYPFYRGGYRLWEVKKYLQSADLAFFLNSYDRDYAVSRLGVDASRAKIVDNGLPDIFIGRPFDPDIPQQIKIALIGTFIKRKGIEYSIPALNVLLEKNAHLSVGFFGSRVPAEVILERFGPAVRDRVEVKEQYPHDGLPALLAPYRIFLFASLAEGFPLAPLEAMACGLALVVTDIPGVAERLTHGVNALIIPPRDQQAIQDAIQRLIDDQEFLVSIRRAGHILAQNYSWTRVANDTLALYEEGIKRRSREVLKC
jgi:glycosyltransferase involved in cell wall biosynthesis